MTLQQCEQRNNAVLQAWREWKNGENYLENLDCAILAEMFCIDYPKACQKYLIYTDEHHHAKTTTTNRQALETIFNFLEKLYKTQTKK